MARVFDVPTYRLQTYHSIINLINLAHAENKRIEVPDLMTFKRRAKVCSASEAFISGMDDDDVEEWNMVNPDKENLDYEGSDEQLEHDRFCYLEGLKTRSPEKHERLVSYGMVIADLLRRFKYTSIYTDFDAAAELARKFMNLEIKPTAATEMHHMWNKSSEFAKWVATAGLASCQVGMDQIKCLDAMAIPVEYYNEHRLRAKYASEVWEKARLNLITGDVRRAHSELLDGDVSSEDFRVKKSYVAKHMGIKYIYKISIFAIFICKSDMYILDYAHLDQVRAVIRSWYGMEEYVAMYRPSSNEDSPRFSNAYRYLFSWMCKHMQAPNDVERLAKYMKTCLARLQNDFHNHSEKLETGSASRSENLKIEADELMQLPESWYDALLRSGANWREMNNLAYLFHLIPAPDAEVGRIFDRVTNQMNNANKENPQEFKQFMNYVKANDVMKFTVKSRGSIKLTTVPGYTYEDKDWYKSCKKGSFTLPPVGEWGMSWIENKVQVPVLMPHWYTSCGDVTRVPPDKSRYSKQSKKIKGNMYMSNELLYVLKNAPYIDGNITPEQLLERAQRGDYNYDKIADTAIKSENTKYGEKMRETYSGDAITREYMTEADHCAIPIAADYKGATSRKSNLQVLEIFDKMCEYTVSKALAVIVSTDISGWSPSASRKAWLEHHQYRINMTNIGQILDINKIIDGIDAGLHKRGFLRLKPLTDGLFQGWTGTLDTLLNILTCLYAVRVGKNRGYLPPEAKADTAGLIDDAVQGVEFPSWMTHEQAQLAANQHLNTTQTVWSWISAEVSMVKTIYSTIKFIFLNRFHCEGSEVLADMKTFAKVDRDYTRRLSTLNQQVDTVMGGYRAASEKGSDPLLCYFCGLKRSFEMICMTNKHILHAQQLPMIVAAFAPRTLNGFGFNHFTAFITKERVDNLTMFIGVIARFAKMLSNASAQHMMFKCFASFIHQELAYPGPIGVLNDPWNVRAKTYTNHEMKVYRILRKRMQEKCTSKVLMETFKLASKSDIGSVWDAFLKSYEIDAHVLGALAATMPETIIQGMIEKAHKADLLLSLFQFRMRSSLIYMLREGNYNQIERTIRVMNQQDMPPVEVTPYNYIRIAHSLRESYFKKSGYSIINNTIADPATMLARQNGPVSSGITVHINKIRSNCSDMTGNHNYLNIFDGVPERIGRRGFVTKGIFDFIPEATRGMSQIQKCVHKASQIVAHIGNTCNIEETPFLAIDVWRVVCACWGVATVTEYKLPMFYITPDTKWARIDPSSFNKSHPIACYPNAHNSVVVSAAGMARVYDIQKTSSNLASVITAAKVAGLMVLAKNPNDNNELHYAVLEDAILPFGIVTKHTVANTINRDIIVDELEGKMDDVDNSFSKAFKDAMVNYEDLTPGDDDSGEGSKIVKIVYASSSILQKDTLSSEVREQLRAYYQLDNLCDIDLARGYKSSKKQTKRAKKQDDNADERIPMKRRSPGNRYKSYLTYMSPDQAGIQVLADLVADNVPSFVDDKVLMLKWREMRVGVPKYLTKWKEYIENAIAALHSIEGYISISLDTIKQDLGLQTYHQQLFISTKTSSIISDFDKLEVFCVMYFFNLGKFKTPNQYTNNSRVYPNMMEKQWRTASKVAGFRMVKAHGQDAFTEKMKEALYMSAAKLYMRNNFTSFLSNVYNDSLLATFGTGCECDERQFQTDEGINAAIDEYIGCGDERDEAFNVNEISTTIRNIREDYKAYIQSREGAYIWATGGDIKKMRLDVDLSGFQDLSSMADMGASLMEVEEVVSLYIKYKICFLE